MSLELICVDVKYGSMKNIKRVKDIIGKNIINLSDVENISFGASLVI